MMMKELLSYYQIQSLLLRPFCAKTLVLMVLEHLKWLVQYQEKRILFHWIPSHVGIIGNEERYCYQGLSFMKGHK